MTVVLAMNEKDTLRVVTAIADLQSVITATDPDFGILNEWTKDRDGATKNLLSRLGYGFARPRHGGNPVFWRLAYGTPKIKGRILALPGYVGRLPGRRSTLGASMLTQAVWKDTGRAVLGFHMTAEVQDVRGGGSYKTDRAHWLRVRRHKREKRRAGRVARRLERAGLTVYVGGDTNFSGMTLGGFDNCWEGYSGGDLGGRAVTIVYATRKPAKRPQTVRDHSDHFAVAVTYP